MQFTVQFRSIIISYVIFNKRCNSQCVMTKFRNVMYVLVAQWIEQPPPKRWVTGSTPVGDTINLIKNYGAIADDKNSIFCK